MKPAEALPIEPEAVGDTLAVPNLGITSKQAKPLPMGSYCSTGKDPLPSAHRAGPVVVARSPVNRCANFREQVEAISMDHLTLCLFHKGCMGYRKKYGVAFLVTENAQALLKLRYTRLKKLIIESQEFARGDYRGSFIHAFGRMDMELEQKLEGMKWYGEEPFSEVLWRTAYNTSVVLVNHDTHRIYVAGLSARVIVTRDGKDYLFTSDSDVVDLASAHIEHGAPPIPQPKHADEHLFFYREAKFKPTDTHLCIFSFEIYMYAVRDSFAKILESRKKALGFLLACKSIVGRAPSPQQKCLIAVELNGNQAHNTTPRDDGSDYLASEPESEVSEGSESEGGQGSESESGQEDKDYYGFLLAWDGDRRPLDPDYRDPYIWGTRKDRPAKVRRNQPREERFARKIQAAPHLANLVSSPYLTPSECRRLRTLGN